MKKKLIKALLLSGILLSAVSCKGGNTDPGSSGDNSSNPGTSSYVDPEDEPELPTGADVTVYLVLSKIGLYENNPGTKVEEYSIENAITYNTKVGDPLPGADKVTSTSGATFVSWVKYDGNGAPTKYETAPNKNHQILYVNWSSGSGGGGGGGGGGTVVPTSGFHIKVTSDAVDTYYAAADTGEVSYGKHVYRTSTIALKANDVFCMFDGSTGASFNCINASTLYVASGLEGRFTYQTNNIKVNTAGSYVIEMQLKTNDDSYYIHL